MKYLVTALVPLALAGCTEPVALPVDSGLTRALDPSQRVAPPPGPSVAYRALPIAEPLDWRQLNDAQSPGGGA